MNHRAFQKSKKTYLLRFNKIEEKTGWLQHEFCLNCFRDFFQIPQKKQSAKKPHQTIQASKGDAAELPEFVPDTGQIFIDFLDHIGLSWKIIPLRIRG